MGQLRDWVTENRKLNGSHNMKHVFSILLLASMSVAHVAAAKGHDQGVADGMEPPAGPGALAGAVDDGQKNGQRGDAASGSKGDNRVEPVAQPGKNKP